MKSATTAAFLAVLLVAAADQDALHFVVVVEKGNGVAKTMITETLTKAADAAVAYSLVELDPEEFKAGDVCSAIFADPKPDLLIDAVRVPGSTVHKLSTTVRDTARRMGLPTLSLTYSVYNDYTLSGWNHLTPLEREYLIHVTPPGESYTQVIRYLCEKMDLSTAGIIYDSTVIIDHKYARLLENLPTRHIMRKVDGTKQDFKRQVKDILYTDVSNFFVLGSADTMNRALELISKYKWNNCQFAWFLISRENYVPVCSECDNVAFIMAAPEPANLDLLAKAKKEKHFKGQKEQLDAAFYADVTRMIVRAAKEERVRGRLPPGLEYPTCTKMDLTSSMSGARSNITLRKAMMRMRYAGPFGPIVIREEENGYQEITMSVKRASVPRKGESMTVTMVAKWTHKEPEGVLVENPGVDLKKYAAVTLFRVTTVVHPPFVVKNNNSNGEDQFEGYCIDLMDEIKKLLKFEYTIYEVPDKTFGSLEGNTTEWNGMVRQLLDNNADIALGPLSVTAERETVVDYTMPFYDMVGIGILMKKPASKSSLFKFLTVLEGSVWGCILAAYFFTSLLMYLFDRYSPYSYRNNKEKYKDDEDKRDFSLKESLWFCMTSLTPQGGGEAPRNLSGRLVAATWWLFGFIIIASYTANLAAFLTVSRLDTPIESLDDLAKQYKIQYAPQNGTAAMTYFKRMADIEEKFYDVWKNMSLDDSLSDEDRAKLAVWDYPVSDKYTKMWQSMRQTQIPADFEEGLRRVKESNGSQEGFAFLADATLVRYAIMTDCELTSVGSEFSRMPLALAVQKHSPLKDQLSSAILKLHNDGRLDDLKEMWWNKNPARANCDDSDGQSDAIGIRNIGGVFIVIGIGVVMALIALAIEYCYFKIRMRKAKVIAVKAFPGKGSAKEPVKH